MCKVVDLMKYKLNKLEKVIKKNQDKLELGIEIYNKAVKQFEKTCVILIKIDIEN